MTYKYIFVLQIIHLGRFLIRYIIIIKIVFSVFSVINEQPFSMTGTMYWSVNLCVCVYVCVCVCEFELVNRVELRGRMLTLGKKITLVTVANLSYFWFLWRHKKKGLSTSFLGVFFPIFPLISLIFMTPQESKVGQI